MQHVSFSSSNFFTVACPSSFQDPEVAITRLGTRERIAEAYTDPHAHALTYSFRPGDPYHHPITATKTPVSKLLLKVALPTKSKKKARTTTNSTHYEIVGTIRQSFVFQGLADYQYLCPPKLANKAGIEDLLKGFMHLQRLEIVPVVFSKWDQPKVYRYEHYGTAATPNLEGGENPTQIIPAQAAASRTNTVYIDAESKQAAPTEPPASSIRIPFPDSVEERVRGELIKKFEQQPVWLRRKLLDGKSDSEKKAIDSQLPSLAYMFPNGPWRKTCIRFGYDPRIHPEASWYQSVEVRCFSYRSGLFSSTKLADTDNRSKRPEQTKERRPRRVQNRHEAITKPVRLFGTEIDQKSANVTYQLLDLKDDPEFADLFERFPRRSASARHGGWYTPRFLEVIRGILKLRLESLLNRSESDIAKRQAALKTLREKLDKSNDEDDDEDDTDQDDSAQELPTSEQNELLFSNTSTTRGSRPPLQQHHLTHSGSTQSSFSSQLENAKANSSSGASTETSTIVQI